MIEGKMARNFGDAGLAEPDEPPDAGLWSLLMDTGYHNCAVAQPSLVSFWPPEWAAALY